MKQTTEKLPKTYTLKLCLTILKCDLRISFMRIKLLISSRQDIWFHRTELSVIEHRHKLNSPWNFVNDSSISSALIPHKKFYKEISMHQFMTDLPGRGHGNEAVCSLDVLDRPRNKSSGKETTEGEALLLEHRHSSIHRLDTQKVFV